MSFLNDFEGRISSVFGAAPQGYTEPFSFKKLAKRAAREMENETYEIDGVDTAPALYTVLVSPSDDSLMRPLYEQITHETSAFVTAQAQKKGYTFVSADVAMVPSTTTTLTDPDQLVQMGKLLDALDDDDDVQNAWHSLENEEDLDR